MKRTAILAGVITLFSFSASAQDPEPATEQTAEHTNPTVASIQSKYKLLPMPEPMTIEKVFPVLGNYEVMGPSQQTSQVNVSIDPQNKGIIWISGLAEGKVKGLLRKAPAVYRIPAQKTEDGKSIAEGTLIYDRETNQFQLCLGCKYNEEDPAAAFSHETESVANGKNGKAKLKVVTYVGQKIEMNTAPITEAVQQEQQ